jgi:hypothetical protein
MKLYKITDAPAGDRWHASKTGLKDPVDLELPRDGRAGMAAFLNANEREVSGNRMIEVDTHAGDTRITPVDELEQAELRAVYAETTMSSYQSPFTARTVIAGIDAGMCAQAIVQMDGPNLAKVVSAAIERMAQLSGGLPRGETNNGGS